MQEVPDCELVITSTWRFQILLGRLREYFSLDVAARVVGITPRFGGLKDITDSLIG